MRSTVYMNHYPHYSSPDRREAVTADLTASIGLLASGRCGLGKAVNLAFQTLGADRIWETPRPSDMLVIGSAETAARNLKSLRMKIGRIAECSADESLGHMSSYRTIGETLDHVTQNIIPRTLDTQGGFIHVVGNTLCEFGELCNDDGCGVNYGRRVGWYSNFRGETDTLKALPFRALKNITDVRQIRYGVEDISKETILLGQRAIRWLHANKDEALAPKGLYKNSPTYKKFVLACQRDEVALRRADELLHARSGRGFTDLILPPDVVDNLVDEQLRVMDEKVPEDLFHRYIPGWKSVD